MLSSPLFFLISQLLVFVAGTVNPFPPVSCNQFDAFQCPSQSGCCAGGGTCCAGGCCGLTDICVFPGTSNEACCPLSDSTRCGAHQTTAKATATCGGAPAPSKLCVAVSDDWYCPPGAICGARSGLCIGGNAPCTDAAAATTSIEASSPAFTPTSSDGGAAVSTTSLSETSGSSTVVGATTASVTTKSGGGRIVTTGSTDTWAMFAIVLAIFGSVL